MNNNGGYSDNAKYLSGAKRKAPEQGRSANLSSATRLVAKSQNRLQSIGNLIACYERALVETAGLELAPREIPGEIACGTTRPRARLIPISSTLSLSFPLRNDFLPVGKAVTESILFLNKKRDAR